MESQDLEVEQSSSLISDRDGSHPFEEFDLSNDNSNLETGNQKDDECLDSRVLLPMEHIDLMQECSFISDGDGDQNESSNDVQDSTVTDPLDIGTGNEDPLQNLTCSVCLKTFCHPSTLRLHMLRHTGAEPYSCSFCSKKFPVLIAMKNHLVTHTGEKPYPCEICKERFSRKSSLQRHLLIHSDPSKYPACRVCKVKFSHESSLYRHMKTHPGETPFACPKCPEKFVWHTLLKKHIRFTHRENLFKQRTTCSVCSKSLATTALKQHMLIHTGEKPFQCEFCQKSFTCQSTYKRHLSTHTGLKPFPCLYCEKSFVTRKDLARHTTSTHTCLNCGEMFTEKSQLKNHIILAHNGTWKQFSCTVCSKRFSRFQSLREHIKDKACLVTCTVCRKSMSSARLGRHMKTHESSTCRICTKRFPRPHIMKTHMLAKHAEDLDRIIRNNIAKRSNNDSEKFSCKNTVINTQEVVKTVIRNNSLQTNNDLEKVDLMKTNGFERNTGHSKLIQINEVDATNYITLTQSNKTVTKQVIIDNDLEKVECNDALVKTNGFERNNENNVLIQTNGVDVESNKTVTKQVIINVMTNRNEDEVEYIIDSPTSCKICSNSRVIKHLVMNAFDELEKNDIKNKSTNEIEIGDRCSTGIESHDYFHKQNSEGGHNLSKNPDRVDSSNGNSDNETGFLGKDNECLVPLPMEHIELTQESGSSRNMDDDQTNQSKNDVNLKSIATDPLDIGTGNEDRLQKLTCWVCSKTFCHPSTLRLHMLRHTGAEPYSCSFCSKKFPVLRGLENHLVTHTGEKPFSCRICKERFSHYSTLHSHLIRHSGPSKYPACVVCKVKFSHHSSLRRHMKTHPGETPFPCTLCSKQFSWHTHLKRHMLTHEDYIKKISTCSVCSKTFATPNTLKIHMRTHTGEKLFQCKLCLTSFTTNFTYKEHLSLHIGEKSFSCIYCPKSFVTKNRLIRHIKTAHTCPNCGEIFAQRSLLKSHILIHYESRKQVSEDVRESIENSQFNIPTHNTVESRKQFSCTVCSKRFIHSSNLELHMAMHTGERPFACTICQQRFISSKTLERHTNRKICQYRVPCSVCHKFIFPAAFKNHMETHKLISTLCRKKYTSSQGLECHMLTHTEEMNEHNSKIKTVINSNKNFKEVNNCNNMVKHTHKSVEKVVVIRNNSLQTNKDLEKVSCNNMLKKTDENIKKSSGNNNTSIEANEEKASNNIMLTKSSKTVKKQVIINIMTEDKVEYIIDNPISCKVCMNSRVIKHLVPVST